ncbi:hypothetical protein FSP39_021733 [Pinctada imbricata]|uniref:C2H2-type domain-containing protein n=1 Tax=Pinctada imbricata TaxID=66713 RepID=A0AA88YL45_PINIB|nr:hypothetical protein FSP39_021733 [Pinctada imbricata]
MRNLVNHRTVSAPQEVISDFRSHHQYVTDVTDAYLVSACLDILDMEDTTSAPQSAPFFSLIEKTALVVWLNCLADKVLDYLHLNGWDNFLDIKLMLENMSADDDKVEAMKLGNSYQCALCGKLYVRKPWLKQHLKKKHAWQFHNYTTLSKKKDPNLINSFLKMSMLYRDTCDAFSLGDGHRIMRNAKMDWIYASALHHSKYKLWLWRLITYVIALLPPDQAFEYMWNMTVNLKGGIYNNIPNDNCVELQAGNIKKELNTQGANKTSSLQEQFV